MTFLHPALLATAGGLALLPLVIHLLSRRGYQSQPWAAMMFLAAAQKSAERRIRVERWLLLVLRTLIIVILGMAIARPLATGSLLGDALARPRFDRVIILDDSLSMQAVHPDGSTSFDAAKALARKIIDESEPRDGLALIAASQSPRTWMDQPMHDRQALRGILDEWKCTWATDDVPGAMRLAADLLSRGQAAAGARWVYFISDGTTTSPVSSNAATSAPEESGKRWHTIDRTMVLNVGPVSRDNVAVTGLTAASQIVGVGVPARFNVRIANHSSRPVERVNCDIVLDGAVASIRAVGPIESHAEASDEFELVFNTEGPHRVAAQIKTDDALTADNARFLGVQVAPGLSVLAVEGSVDSRKASRELFYYAVAVSSPTLRSDRRGIQLRTISPLELEAEVLADYSVVVLGNVRNVPEAEWGRIERFVRAGGGLLVVCGDRILTDYFNDVGAKHTGLFPFELEDQAKASAQPWRVRIDEPGHLALTDLVNSDRGGIRVALVNAYWKCRPRAADRALHVPLRVSNGDPLLIQSDVGQGRVLFWLTSGNMAWNNLPAKPDYVPLMLNLTLFAAGCDRNARDLLVGQTVFHADQGDETRNAGVIQRPDGGSVKVDWTSTPDAAAVAYSGTDRPGFYGVTVGRERFIYAVNIDPREGNLSPADATVVRQALGDDTKIVVRVDDVLIDLGARPPREIAPLIMFVLLIVLSLETIVAMLFRGQS